MTRFTGRVTSKGGQSAPLFGNFLEPLSKTPWWLIPTLWLPCVAYGTYEASKGFEHAYEVAPAWLVGLGVWTLIEYILHRFLFHLDEYVALQTRPERGYTAHQIS